MTLKKTYDLFTAFLFLLQCIGCEISVVLGDRNLYDSGSNESADAIKSYPGKKPLLAG